MNKYYYLSSQNEQQGPVEVFELKNCGVTSATLVWTQGMAQWAPAGEVEELKTLFMQPAPTPPAYIPPKPAIQAQPPSQPAAGNYNRNEHLAVPGHSDVQVKPPVPDSNMVWAVLSTILCCLPTGIYAIICASEVDKYYAMGDYATAQDKARKAKNWAIYGAIASVIGVVAYILFYVLVIAAAVGSSSF